MSRLHASDRASAYATTFGGWADSLVLVARLCLAVVFLYSGAVKLLAWHAAVSEFAMLGVPLPVLAVTGTVVVQLLGGLAIALGWRVRAAAAALAAFTVIATLVGHPFWAFAEVEFQRHLTTALEHLAIVGGFLLLTVTGPGRLSLEGKGGT